MEAIVKTCAWYVSEAKRALGNAGMSDRELGEHLGFSQPNVNRAKAGYMTDPMARAIAEATQIDEGEILFVAHVSRDTNPSVRDYVSRTFGPRKRAAV
ncbi:MAG TPA: hypothetical protein VNU71_05735 [Burkholderiaceae bacterium]|nr:hypothetical protein [Burkholderiaceae bacterium]